MDVIYYIPFKAEVDILYAPITAMSVLGPMQNGALCLNACGDPPWETHGQGRAGGSCSSRSPVGHQLATPRRPLQARQGFPQAALQEAEEEGAEL